MQNMIPKFRGSSVVSEEPGYSCEKLKTLTRFNYHRIFFFLMTFCTRFIQCLQKGVWDFFVFCLDLELLIKKQKTSM